MDERRLVTCGKKGNSFILKKDDISCYLIGNPNVYCVHFKTASVFSAFHPLCFVMDRKCLSFLYVAGNAGTVLKCKVLGMRGKTCDCVSVFP